MKLGVINDLRNPQRWHLPWPQHYDGFLKHIAQLEQLGFDEVVIPEHHFDPDGYVPNPIPILSALARETSRIRLGSDLFVLPNHHPVRLAEDVAMVDILSNGRVIFRAGAGGRRGEPPALGFEEKTRLGRNSEAIDIIKRCWTEEVFDYDGKYWQLQGVRTIPKPVQKPHPPIMFPAMNPKAMERNARFGYGANMGNPTGSPAIGYWKDWHKHWEEALARHGRSAAECPTSFFFLLFASEDPERDWAKHRESTLHVAQSYGMMSRNLPMYDKPEDMPNWRQIFQTPDDCVTFLQELFGEVPPDTLVLWDLRPSMSYDEAYQHHKLFMEKVWPRVRDMTWKQK